MSNKLAIVLALMCVSGAAFAQNASGRISGTVSDNSGAVIPGVKVTVTNQDTRLTWKASTDAAGFYVVPDLPVGTYTVMVQADGFRKAERTGYDLPDAGRLTADFKLEVGAVTESVTISEVIGETVNTVSGELAHTIDSEQVEDMALNGRNYIELATLVPGVAMTSLDQMATTTSLSVTNQSFNGNRTDTNHLMVDGGANLDSGSNGSQINNVGVDFIQQVRIQTSGFSAEYGRNSGANINVVTKSGGMTYHGSVFETIRNDALDANAFFAAVKPELRFNDFGWSFGGPIAVGKLKKGKLFFFGGEEWKKIRRTSNPTRQTMPTLAETQGNFADRTTTSIYYPGTKTAIPNKNLAPLMTPDGRAMMNVYAKMIQLAAGYSNTPTGNNATYQMPNPFNFREDIARTDYRVTDRHSLYFRYLNDNYHTIDPFSTFGSSNLPTVPTLRDRPGYGLQLGYVWTVSPAVVNEARINTSWNSQHILLQGDDWMRSTYGFQFPLIYGGIGKYPDGIPTVTTSGFAGFIGPSKAYMMSPTTDISLADNLTYIHGRHAIKTGVMLVRNRKDQNGQAVYLGSVAFNNTTANTMTSNYTLSDVALGQFYTYTEAQSDPIGFFRFGQYEGYVQDSIKVASHFSIEIGARYSHYIPTYTVANNIANFVPWQYNPAQAVKVTTGGLIVPGSGNPYDGMIRAGNGVPADQLARVPGGDSATVLSVPAGAPRGLYNTQDLLMPRFGFAWQPFGNTKTSVRGGFGAFHDRPEGNLVISQTTLPPYSLSTVHESGNLSNPSGGALAAPAPLGTITAMDPNLKIPLVYNFNLGVQRELGRGFFLDVTYAGNLGRHLIREPNINFPSFSLIAANYALPSASRPVQASYNPYLGYNTINYYVSDSNSNYNSLQTYLTKRKGSLVMTFSYTWSHALADSPANYGSGTDAVEFNNRHYNYGPTNYDRRQLLVSTYTYRIPIFAHRGGILGTAFGRWELSGMTRFQTGQYLTPTGSATGITRRSSYLGLPVSIPNPGPNKWFNTAAFANAPTAALGNAGVGTIEGPDWFQWDASLRKVFVFRERCNLRFQADSFNLPNHTNFDNPNVSTSGGASYGTVSSAEPPRNIQFGVRLTF